MRTSLREHFGFTNIRQMDKLNIWERLNNWVFLLLSVVLCVFGWLAVYTVVKRTGVMQALNTVGQMSLFTFAASTPVVGWRLYKDKMFRWWMPLAVGLVIPPLLLGLTMLSTPPFGDYFKAVVAVMLASLVFCTAAQWMKGRGDADEVESLDEADDLVVPPAAPVSRRVNKKR